MAQAANWFHAHQDTIGRSSGRTATGIASYVTGQRIKDEETGKWLKRNHPGDVTAFGTVAPCGAPDYLTDNSQLARAWNEAQQADSRKNAQLARHWNIALSREMTSEQQAEVMTAIAQAFTDRYGTMTTWAVHSATDHGDGRNAHGHIVHNMRMVTPEGFGAKVVAPVVFKTAKWEMEWARGMIAAKINEGLERAGLAERVTHLSFEAQGIDREPTKHLGDKQNQAELKGEATPTGDHNRAVAERNAEREAEAMARQAVGDQLSAEIIDLQEERRRRNQGMQPAEVSEDDARRQAERQREAYQWAEQVHRAPQREQHGTQGMIDAAKRQAEEAERDKARRQAEDTARREAGEPVDARNRYAQALNETYDARDPFGSLAKASLAEHQMFMKGQQALKEQIAREQDPARKQTLEQRQQIEAHDYMAITHDRLAGATRAITGSDSDQARRDDAEASRHRARTMEVKAGGGEQTAEKDPGQTQQPSRQDGPTSAPAQDASRAKPDVTDPENQEYQKATAERGRDKHLEMQQIKERLQVWEEQQKKDAERFIHEEDKRRRADATRAVEGDVTDANNRWALAVGANYDVRDPYRSLAAAAMDEYRMFRQGQDDLAKQIAKEQDPAKRHELEVRKRVEGCDYLGMVLDRNAGIGETISGRSDHPDVIRDKAWASAYRDMAKEGREELAHVREERDKASRSQMADKLGGLTKDLEHTPAEARGSHASSLRKEKGQAEQGTGFVMTHAAPGEQGRSGAGRGGGGRGGRR